MFDLSDKYYFVQPTKKIKIISFVGFDLCALKNFRYAPLETGCFNDIET